MNCEKCQELLSDFLDDALSAEDYSTLHTHLEECFSCFSTRQEIDAIVNFCREQRGQYDAPPNEKALWLRIRNTVENDSRGLRRIASGQTRPGVRAPGWLSGLLNKQWELTFPQMAAAVVTIAIAVSFATAFGLRTMQPDATPTQASSGTSEPTMSRNVSATYPGSLEDRYKQQQQLIDYWNRRVEQRKALWNVQTREAFERNLQVIDQAVYAHREELRRNPNDEVSEEMLDMAMNEKMDLLREFSDL